MITTLKRDTPYPWDYTSKYFEKTFIKDLAKSLSNHMENPSAISALMDDISNTAQTIFFRNLGFVEDRASQLNFLMTSYLLASYMHLKQLSLNIEVKALLSSVFKGVGAFWIKWPVRISLYFSKDRLATLKRASIDRTRVAYGSTFQIDMEESGQKGFVSVVKKCGYFDFFKRENAAELTQLMCDWDWNWAAEIKETKHKVRFSRPQTIAEGSDCCRFEFFRC